MKTKAEYRTRALLLAKENGFDKVHFQGMFNDREVYTCDYNVPLITGLPKIIFASKNGVEFDTSMDPFTILNACKKLPSVVFEYDCFCFFGTSYKYTLFSDGRFIKSTTFSISITELSKENSLDPDEVIITSAQLVSAVKKVIKENREELKLIPRELGNPHILDGATETIKFGRKKISGPNIFTESMTETKKWYEQNHQEVPDWVNNIMKLQKIFKKVEKAINEFVKVRLVK